MLVLVQMIQTVQISKLQPQLKQMEKHENGRSKWPKFLASQTTRKYIFFKHQSQIKHENVELDQFYIIIIGLSLI